MIESFWRSNPIEDLSEWFANFSHRRYGFKSAELEEAWQIMGSSIYNCCQGIIDLNLNLTKLLLVYKKALFSNQI